MPILEHPDMAAAPGGQKAMKTLRKFLIYQEQRFLWFFVLNLLPLSFPPILPPSFPSSLPVIPDARLGCEEW